MATFTGYKEEMKKCPYNPLHQVSARRFQQHINACAKSGMYDDLAICPYNASHRIKQDQFQAHLMNCKDNRAIIREMIERNEHARRISSTEASSSSDQQENLFESGEDWDTDKAPAYVTKGLADDGNEDEKIYEGMNENGDNKNDNNAASTSASSGSKSSSSGGTEEVFKYKTPIELQRMSWSDRNKYYTILAERAKSAKPEAVSSTSTSTLPSSVRSTCISSTTDDGPDGFDDPNRSIQLDTNNPGLFRISVTRDLNSEADIRPPQTQPFEQTLMTRNPKLNTMLDQPNTDDHNVSGNDMNRSFEDSFHSTSGNESYSSMASKSIKRERETNKQPNYIPFINDNDEDETSPTKRHV